MLLLVQVHLDAAVNYFQKNKYEIKLLRGNVNTRLRKLDEGQYDAIILASAGLKRLEFSERIKSSFPVDKMIPSAGQGSWC